MKTCGPALFGLEKIKGGVGLSVVVITFVKVD